MMEKVSWDKVALPAEWSLAGQLDAKKRSDYSGSRILLATQSVTRSHFIAGLLRELRYELVEVNSAADAITQISGGGIELALVDMSLGGMGAIELCRILKKAVATQFLPVLVLAESDIVDFEVRAIEAGADAFFYSPFRVRSLAAHIHSGLRRKTLVDRLDDSESILYSLAQSVEERDCTLGKHCERLAAISSYIGTVLGLPARDIIALQRAGYLHDIGKVSVPDHILLKAGPLTPEEWEVMKSHPEKGERICSSMRSLQTVLPIIRHHHEKWDGSGYPNGLRGEEIPLLARILQLADIYDALTTERTYKRALSPTEAISVIRAETAKGWRDPDLTERFAEMLPVLSNAAAPDTAQLSLQALAGKLTQDFGAMLRKPDGEARDGQRASGSVNRI